VDELYQLDFAQRYRTWFREEVLAFVHLDAANRVSGLKRGSKLSRISASGLGQKMDLLLQRHGHAMRSFAPHLLQRFRIGMDIYSRARCPVSTWLGW
jgi:hypothetical protein